MELNSNSCISDFGLVPQAGTTFYDPVNLPAGVPGTDPVSDVGTFTTFPGPQTIPLTMAAYTSTITMAPWNENAAAATTTEVGGGAQSTRESTSGVDRQGARLGLVGLIVGFMVFAWM